MATNAQLDTRLRTVEAWLRTAETRIKALEAKAPIPGPPGPVGPMGPAGPAGAAADLAPLTDRVTALENHLCPQESRIAALESDHIPTP